MIQIRGTKKENDYYDDVDLYEYHHRQYRWDIPYYRSLAGSSPGPLLELGAGSGRLTLPMLEAGATLTAVDSSPALIARLDERLAEARALPFRARATTCVGDFRELALKARFARVLFPFNTLLHAYTDDDLREALATARRHLAQGGELHFDIGVPDLAYLAQSGLARHERRALRLPGLNEKVTRRTLNLYDAASQLNYAYHDYFRLGAGPEEAPLKSVVLKQRQFFPREMDAHLREAGFVVTRKDGDFSGTPFSGAARVMVYVCERRRDSRKAR